MLLLKFDSVTGPSVYLIVSLFKLSSSARKKTGMSIEKYHLTRFIALKISNILYKIFGIACDAAQPSS